MKRWKFALKYEILLSKFNKLPWKIRVGNSFGSLFSSICKIWFVLTTVFNFWIDLPQSPAVVSDHALIRSPQRTLMLMIQSMMRYIYETRTFLSTTYFDCTALCGSRNSSWWPHFDSHHMQHFLDQNTFKQFYTKITWTFSACLPNSFGDNVVWYKVLLTDYS